MRAAYAGVKAYDTYDNVLYCSSFCKTLAPGFRIGWVAAGKYQAEIEKLKYAYNVATNSLLQDALGRYLESGHYKTHVKKLRFAVQAQLIKYKTAITKYFPDEIKISNPAGGISLWIELPKQIDAMVERGAGVRGCNTARSGFWGCRKRDIFAGETNQSNVYYQRTHCRHRLAACNASLA